MFASCPNTWCGAVWVSRAGVAFDVPFGIGFAGANVHYSLIFSRHNQALRPGGYSVRCFLRGSTSLQRL